MLLYPATPLPRPPVWTCWSACQGFPDVVQRGSGFRRDNELISRQDPVSSSQYLVIVETFELEHTAIEAIFFVPSDLERTYFAVRVRVHCA